MRAWVCAGSGLVLAIALGVLLQPRISNVPNPVSATMMHARPMGRAGLIHPSAESVRIATNAAANSEEFEISPRTRQLLDRLSRPATGNRMTTASAVAWDEMLAEVIASGPRSVPSIREFLAKNSINDWDMAARRVLGYDSAREAIFDALFKIGGAEAEAALASTLAETRAPREIALLARNLELMAPGQYRQAALDAARQSLLADGSGSSEPREVAPLFEVLHRLGDISVVPDLEDAAARWNYYATMSLARLPDGAGIPALIHLAEGFGQGKAAAAAPAVRMLGSLAVQNEVAQAAFLELARNDRIPIDTWNQLGPILAGIQVQFAAGVFSGQTPLDLGAGAQRIHLALGNQNYWQGLPAIAAPAEHWEKQLAWLDQLASMATTPAAQAAIQDAWKLILVRLGPLTARLP